MDETDDIVGVRRIRRALLDLERLGVVECVGADEHGRPLWGLTSLARGLSERELAARLQDDDLRPGPPAVRP